ncbi:MAG: hypothetical protein M3P18_19250 [Actinomycetota bacterium]|nr:hypothetical protein [Actinomycetota bacterium]
MRALLDGAVAGHWRRTIAKDSVVVEAYLYEDLKPRDALALEAAADDLGRFLQRRATVTTRRLASAADPDSRQAAGDWRGPDRDWNRR